MKKETAMFLAPIVKQHKLREALKDYANERIEWHYKELETCTDIKLKYHQGAISELKRILSLENEVIQSVKD